MSTANPLRDPLVDDSHRMVTWRSILAGLVGVVLICGLAPYNNYVIGNTYLVGGTLPIGLLLYLMLLLMINAGLHRLTPRQALCPGELVIATVMTLVACALPGPGLMQYLPAPLVGLYHQAGLNFDFGKLLGELGLPQWLFPDTAGKTLVEKANDPVIRYFWARTPEGEGFGAWKWSVPWLAWIRPMLIWGALVAAICGTITFLSCILYEQWAHNERLPFPIASIYTSLIEPPAPGRAFNALLSSRSFWIAAAVVFILHSTNILATYFPRVVPPIPLTYNLWGILSEPPFSFVEWAIKQNRIYFMVVGLTFFLQGRIALSLWLGYLILQVAMMQMGTIGNEITEGMRKDQTFGSMLVYTVMILWLGRRHWRMVLNQMTTTFFKNRKDATGKDASGNDQGRFISYRLAGWGFLISAAGIVGWLVAAGTSLWGAVILVAVLIMFLTLLSRIIAETGLAFVQLNFTPQRLWSCLRDWSGGHLAASPRTFFHTAFMNATFMHDSREPLGGYVSHALKTADVVEERRPGRLRGVISVMVLALVVGYAVSSASMLWSEYHYSATQGRVQTDPINSYGVVHIPENMILRPTQEYLSGTTAGPHSPLGHVATGATITGILAFLTLRFSNWPFHPIGFLVVYSFPMARMWFSIFIGWLLKTLIVRYGGATMFRNARPLFIGLIIGEAGAAGFWLVVSLVLHAMGMNYSPSYFTP